MDDQDTSEQAGFKPRTSLGRSPPGGSNSNSNTLTAPPTFIASKAFHPSAARALPEKELGKEKEKDKETKKKKRSPTDQNRRKRLKSQGRALESGSSSDEGEGTEKDDDEEEISTSAIIDEACEGLCGLLESIFASRKAITAAQLNKIKELTVTLKKEVRTAQLNYATLTGKYEEVKRANREILQMKAQHDKFLSNVEKSTRKEIKETIERQAKIAPQRVSYASAAAAVAVPSLAQASKSGPSTKVLLCYPKEGNKDQTSEETKSVLQAKVKPTAQGFRINRLTKIRNGGVAVEVSEEQAKELKKHIGRVLETREPMAKKPKIKLFDVPNDTAEGDVREMIRMQNFDRSTKEEFENEFKVIYKLGDRTQDTVNWVIEVSPEIRNQVLEAKGRIFIGWRACKAVDHLVVARCYKCQKFGHMAKVCNAKKDTCGHCAEEGHTYKECKNKKKAAKCVNCSRYNLPSSHEANAADCPTYIREKSRLSLMTKYN